MNQYLFDITYRLMSDRVISKSEILSRVPNKYALSSRAGVFLSMPIENKIVSVVDEESSTARLFHDTLCTIKVSMYSSLQIPSKH